jgi:hypothetical protein
MTIAHRSRCGRERAPAEDTMFLVSKTAELFRAIFIS